MKIAILTLTGGGNLLAEQISAQLADCRVFFCRQSLASTLNQVWPEYDSLVFIMAAGIVVRAIQPYLRDKQTDPAVLVCDEKGNFVVSLLSGHMGGANELARLLAKISGGQAVITTASDVLNHTPIDLWAGDMGLFVRNRKKLTKAMGRLVNDGMVSLYSDFDLPEIPDDFKPAGSPDTADLVITCKTDLAVRGLVLHPKALVAGIGCNRGATEQQISEALSQTCAANNIALESIRNLASADAKKDEQGLIDFGRSQGYEIDFFAPDQLNSVKNITVSPAAMKALGVQGVAEPAAILSAKSPKLIIRKTKWTDVTIAVAQVVSPWSEPAPVPLIT